MNKMEKTMVFLHKRIWWILGGIIFLYPFYCLLLGEIKSFGKLYTFGLPLNEFMTIWIAMGGIIGVVSNIRLTQKRIFVQEKQQESQRIQFETQIEKQNEQIKIQEKQSRDNRFASGIELLGNTNESARIGGAYNLYFLAKEYPDEYLNAVCKILCAHIRTITNKQEYKIIYVKKTSNEVQTILDLLFQKDKNDSLIFDKCNKNFVGTIFNGTNFCKAILSNVSFSFATLNEVYFHGATLNHVNFYDASLNKVDFIDYAKLSNIIFNYATLSDCKFEYAILSDVGFFDATLREVAFSYAIFKEEVNFTGTLLEKIPPEEITLGGRSFELTKQNIENK